MATVASSGGQNQGAPPKGQPPAALRAMPAARPAMSKSSRSSSQATSGSAVIRPAPSRRVKPAG
ncbi:hypothetical protein [Blastococcus sp. PRF04-17]|uniref:hypothetical protein n=1 Tax=Blastococcus sp. PRF04-17 TaxID=2933797 RepID=UPI001FF211AB|nr:hypothetical protein [Blastococcus sp. PRF04-17]UOY01830.1 hypothetical protein MVA48_00115 [Blastococcus sp. PRF04-17]